MLAFWDNWSYDNIKVWTTHNLNRKEAAQMEKKKAYIYTRVSTAMQVDGYSLEAQEERLRRHCEYHDMEIVRTYTDKGKSGSTIVGREQFQQMLNDIESQKDGVSYVLVYKLPGFPGYGHSL